MNRTRPTAAAAAITLAATLAGAAFAQQNQSPGTPAGPANDQDFVVEAAVGGSTEVAAAKLALQRGESAGVKQFAQQMITDHTAANNELLTLAGRKNIAVPRAVDARHQQALDRLAGLQGARFDQAYGRQMVVDHQETVRLFEGESQNGQDPELKALATRLVPKLKQHLQMAQRLPGGGEGQGGEHGTEKGQTRPATGR